MIPYRFNNGVLIIEEGVTEVPNEAFIFWEDIREVVLPSTLLRIAFQECVNLEKIQFPKGLEEVGFAAFCNCLSLKKPKVSRKTKVEQLAFHGTKQKIFRKKRGRKT